MFYNILTVVVLVLFIFIRALKNNVSNFLKIQQDMKKLFLVIFILYLVCIGASKTTSFITLILSLLIYQTVFLKELIKKIHGTNKKQLIHVYQIIDNIQLFLLNNVKQSY